MRVPEMSADSIGIECVAKCGGRCYGTLGNEWNAVHIRRAHHVHSVPVNTTTLAEQMILDIDHDLITLTDL